MKPDEVEPIEEVKQLLLIGNNKTIVGGDMPKAINPKFDIVPASCVGLKVGKYLLPEVIDHAQQGYNQGYATAYKDFITAMNQLGYNMTADMMVNNILKKLRSEHKLI